MKMKLTIFFVLSLMMVSVYSLPAEEKIINKETELVTEIKRSIEDENQLANVEKVEIAEGDARLTKRSANCGNSSCPMTHLELFVATNGQAPADSADQHEFWLRVKGGNHYYVLPVPPGLGGHATWTIAISDFRPKVAACIGADDIEEIFFKERGNDAWIIQVVTIHYIYECGKKDLGPDHHHFNKRLDGDEGAGIFYLFP